MLFDNFIAKHDTGRQSTEMLNINSRIKRLSNSGIPQEEFLFSSIKEFEDSETRKMMLVAQKYYRNENDITERKRYYIDRKGTRQEAKNLSNSKLVHPFMKKLTNQKISYLLGKEISFQSDDEQFAQELSLYMGKKFFRVLKNVGKDSITNGIAWVQVYYNQDGNLGFKRIPSEEVIPFWADADHTELEGIIRFYSLTEYQPDGVTKEIKKIEYHTPDGVWYYVMGDRGLKPDLDAERDGTIRGHFIISEQVLDENGQVELDESGERKTKMAQATWEKIPFVAFKYNSDEISLLKWIKALVDDYDINTSDTSNNLQDVPNSIKVVKNYDGTDKGEFVQNLNVYRTAFVSGDGDMTTITTPLDTNAIDSHLNRLRKDIYEAGSAVDTQEVSLGNASGVALKFRYADLDADADDMANEFTAALDELIWFIKVDMLNKGIGDFIETEYDIIFNVDGIVNEDEIITDARNSVGIISDETILVNHPWVKDAQRELERLKKEKEEKFQGLQDAMGEEVTPGFGQELDDEGGDREKYTEDGEGGEQ